MWSEKTIKIIPAMLFLFCLLETLELGLVVGGLNKTEKLEAKIEDNLKVLEHVVFLLNKYLEGMELGRLKDKEIKNKQCNRI